MLGIDAELWYLPAASRPLSALPKWSDLDKGLLVHFCQASRTRLRLSRNILDSSTRCEDGTIDVSSYGDTQIAADVEFPWEEKLDAAEEWFNSIAIGTNVAAAVLDSALFASGPAVRTTMLGVWSDWIITEWNHAHPLDGSQRVRLRFVPAWSGYVTTAAGVPAQVVRSFPEIINPFIASQV